MSKQMFVWGTALLGIALILGGAFALWQGWHTRGEGIESLRNENLEVQDPFILLTYEGARAPEGEEVPTVIIDSAAEADAQARVIRAHTMSSTDGLTYSEMGREDPNRELYLRSLTLQNSLHLAHIGLEITRFVMAVGIAFIGMGLYTLVVGLPLVRKIVALK